MERGAALGRIRQRRKRCASCNTEVGGACNPLSCEREERRYVEPLSPPLHALHKRLKAVFDPHGILNAGRLYADL